MKKLMVAIGIAGALLIGTHSGMKDEAAPHPALAIPKPTPHWKTTQVLATAYVVNPKERGHGCEVYSGRTASGTIAKVGAVAVDTSIFRFGTHFEIPNYGRGVARDTGGGIVGHHIDLAMDSCARAIAWGARRITVRYQ